MAERKNFSRRSFLKVAGLCTGVLVAGTGEKILRHLNIGRSFKDEKLSITEREIEDLIDIVEARPPPVFELVENGLKKIIRARANRKSFADAICYLAKNEDPENGIERAYSSLRKNPLKISLLGREPRETPWRKGETSPSAVYENALWFGGPRIKFYLPYLKKYYLAERENDELQRALKINTRERIVWHELIHFWQDVEDPYQHFLNTARYNSREMANQLGLDEQFDKEDNSTEKEANDKAYEFALTHLLNSLGLENSVDKIIGNFISFSQS